MKTSFKVAIAALAISAFVLDGCKKGEGDPFLSLASRKARVAGEWKVSAGSGTSSQVVGSTTITDTWTYDGATQTTTTNPGSTVTTDKFTMDYTFEKDGTFSQVYVDNNGSTAQTTTTTGTWNFTGGVGEMKNKSQIVMTTLSVANSAGTTTYTGSNAPSSIMDIYQLKGKEIIFKGTGTTSVGTQSDSYEWTLTAK